MELLHQSYQAHFFTNNIDVPATPGMLHKLLTGLSGFGLMPTYGNALNARSGEKAQFVIMISPDEKLMVEFPFDRICISSETKPLEEFQALLLPILNELGKIFPDKKGNRLSIVSSKIYGGSSVDYQALYKRLFTYTQVDPFEWENRVALRGQVFGEAINDITTIRRCEFAANFINSGLPSDSIFSEVDTNTDPKNNSPRFNISNVQEKFMELLEKNSISTQKLNRYFES